VENPPQDQEFARGIRQNATDKIDKLNPQ